MQELNNLLTLILEDHNGLFFYYWEPDCSLRSIFGFRNCAFSGMRSRSCGGSTTISKT